MAFSLSGSGRPGRNPDLVDDGGGEIFLRTSEREDFQVSAAFARLEEGYENALKDYYKKQIGQLNMLIACLLGSLNKGERQKVNHCHCH